MQRFPVFLFALFCSLGSAQTDFFYLVSTPEPNGRQVYALGVNSRNFRQLPTSPYPMEVSEVDNVRHLVDSVCISEPGPYMYTFRNNDLQVYGYRRLIDGQLEQLPGFPLETFNEPSSPNLFFISLAKHPILPVIYASDFGDQIRTFKILQGGALLEIGSSPIETFPTAASPGTIVCAPDGKHAYCVTLTRRNGFRGLLVLEIDSAGTIISMLRSVDEDARSLTITDDGKYLYMTTTVPGLIRGFELKGEGISELVNSPFHVPLDPIRLFTKGKLMALGGDDSQSVALCEIKQDGDLVLTSGSPIPIFSANNTYSAFSPRGDRILFGGNTYVHVFDIDESHRLRPHSAGPIYLPGVSWGVSVAPELKGDPFSLRFEPNPALGDHFVSGFGDPNTPFYLVYNGSCTGPYVTDSEGQFSIPVPPIGQDTLITIKPYCDDKSISDSAATVPVLTRMGQWVTILTVFMVGLAFVRRSLKC